MKKLYIPTSTLNFNNILSSESLSPKAFYGQRGFGYVRWTAIPENDLENAILLYVDMCHFTRPKSDVEDHPMLVEIWVEEKELTPIQERVFCCDHTIYLSPWRARFIFFSEQDRKTTLSLSDSSLETKSVNIYRMRYDVEHPLKQPFPHVVHPQIDLNAEALKRDWCVNRMKGLLYGYGVGALLSVSPEVAAKANVLRELGNMFSSILSLGSLSSLQRRRLDEALQKYQSSNPGTITNVALHSLLSRPGKNPMLSWLEWERKALDEQANKECRALSPLVEGLVLKDCRLNDIPTCSVSVMHGKELIKVWVNEVVLPSRHDGRIASFKDKLATELTREAKEVYGQEAWESSAARRLLNEMRRLLNGEENQFGWSEDLLCASMAAVLSKGDDWEQLLQFMQGKSISDYRLAFAFYGELHGFANLPRNFTDYLLDYNLRGRDFVVKIIKEFNLQLLGEDLAWPESETMPSLVESETDDLGQWRESMLRCVKDMPGISLKQWESLNELLEECDKPLNDDDFIHKLNTKKGWGNKSIEKFSRLLKQQVSSPKVVQQEMKFETGNLPREFPALKCLEVIQNDRRTMERLQENWKFTGDQKGYWSDAHINFFIQLCQKEDRDELKVKKLVGKFSEDRAKKVKKELNEIKDRYGK